MERAAAVKVQTAFACFHLLLFWARGQFELLRDRRQVKRQKNAIAACSCSWVSCRKACVRGEGAESKGAEDEGAANITGQ